MSMGLWTRCMGCVSLSIDDVPCLVDWPRCASKSAARNGQAWLELA